MDELSWEKKGETRGHVDVLVIDGYVDEPSLLGVPPYISPEPRMLVGVCEELDLSWEYMTADECRRHELPLGDIVLVHGGVTVPGKYLGGTPMSPEEAEEIADQPGETYLGGPLARYHDVPGYDHYSEKDLCAYFYDSLFSDNVKHRWASLEEREDWLHEGVGVVERHPRFPDPLLAEITTYRGCPRYITGGCSFCSEPDYGKPEFRDQKGIITEIEALHSLGVRNFRIGGQSCIFSYKAEGVGEREVVRPRPEQLKELFEGIEESCPDIDVLHVDNANPAVMVEYKEKAEEILEILKEYTTAGNVIALGMESADEEVIEKNNLNSTLDEVEKAVKMTNKVGRDRGENGMPELLPGINFLAGLKGERKETYEKNLEFLKKLKNQNLWLRRINIRQVLSPDEEFNVKDRRAFKRFKESVRKEIDRPLLREMIPQGTLLTDVYMEEREGKKTFGRQVGSYPILVGIEYELPLGQYFDVRITDHGYRSVTGIHQPFLVNEASYSELMAIPGIGKKRAARIFRERPKDRDEFIDLFEEKDEAERVLEYLSFRD